VPVYAAGIRYLSAEPAGAQKLMPLHGPRSRGGELKI
jgi:hypothetical protein